MKIASDGRLNLSKIFITKIQKSGTLRCIAPLVKIGEIGVRLQGSHIDIDLVDSMCSIDKESNPFFLEEHDKFLDWTDISWHGNDVIKNCQFDFLWVAVDEILDLQLEGFKRCEVFVSEVYLSKDRSTSTMVMLKCYRSQ